MSNRFLGKKITLPITEDYPAVVMFVSSFCSKCFANRKLLQKYFSSQKIYEINIASDNELLKILQPKIVPTIIMVNQERSIVYVHKGIIGENQVKKLAEIVNKHLE